MDPWGGVRTPSNECRGVLKGLQFVKFVAGKVLQKQQKWVNFQNFRLQLALNVDFCTKFIKIGASRHSAPLQKLCAGSMPVILAQSKPIDRHTSISIQLHVDMFCMNTTKTIKNEISEGNYDCVSCLTSI